MKTNKLTLIFSLIALIFSCLTYINTLPQAAENGKSAYEIALDHGFEGSEQEWLLSLVGEDGKDGENGKSAYQIAVDAGYEGTKEEWSQSLFGISDDEELVAFASEISGPTLYSFVKAYEGLSYPTKLGKIEDTQKLNALYDAFYDVFEIEKTLINSITTTKYPGFSYVTSTFSGWGGSIGRPERIETIKFKIRARDKAITQIKVFLTKNDKNGEVIYEEILNVNVESKQEADIFWTLPEVFENTEGLSLYFTYNCNQFCDLYSTTSTYANIPSDQYQAVSTYTTNGKFLSSPSSMTNVVGNPCRYLHVEMGELQHRLVLDEQNNNVSNHVNVFLPKQYELVVGDTFQLFYRGVVQAVDPYNDHIKVKCNKGSAYPRYFEWTPSSEEVGSHTLELFIYDDNNVLLGSDKTTLIVKEAVEPTEDINVLCVGDSLTAGGLWPSEANRRLTATDGTPVGNALNNIKFVGTKKVNNTSYEGNGGWTWGTYLTEKSPFYDETTQRINFTTYCERNNIEDIDVVYFLLTWNGLGYNFKTDFNVNEGHFKNAQTIIDQIHKDYPNAIIRCMGIQMPSQNGGTGYSYGATGTYSDAYGILVTAMYYNQTLEKMCQLDKYKDFVKYVDVAGQFDTDNNMPSIEKQVNTRNPKTETFGTNGVHPSKYGYLQIGDAAYRSLVHDICQYYQ